MRLLLICKTPIVVKIFSLVCEKLNITLELQDHNNVENEYDIIILDEEYIDESFNIKKGYCKKIGAISAEDLPFDKSRDFIIPRPFLPLQLQSVLEDVVDVIFEDRDLKEYQAQKEMLSKEDDDGYMGSLADFIAKDIEVGNDESIVTASSVRQGGVLDQKDLGTIKNLLDIDPIENEIEMNEHDWQDLDELIDKALEEVKEYEFDLSGVSKIKLTLNKFTMEELKPLLLKLDQNSIDRLTNGNSINLELKLKENY